MSDTQVGQLANADPNNMNVIEAIEYYSPQFATALPHNISMERFKDVLLTAVRENPDLIAADRRTLMSAAVKCARDGLYPDGREAALVSFNTKVKRNGVDVMIKAVQYLPMIAGIRKRMRNTGEVKSAIAEPVHRNDHFIYRKGDDPMIEHAPPPLGQDRGEVIGFYSIIKLTNGEILREVMSVADVEYVRRTFSRMPDSPAWKKSFNEMGCKTVLRRNSKDAPSGSELDRLLGRMDEAEISADPHYALTAPPRPRPEDFVDIPDTAPEPEEAPETETTPTWAVQLPEGEVIDFDDPEEAAEKLIAAFASAPTVEAVEALRIDNREMVISMPERCIDLVKSARGMRIKFLQEKDRGAATKPQGSPPASEEELPVDTAPAEPAITETSPGPTYDVAVPLGDLNIKEWYNPAKKMLDRMKRDQRPPVDYQRFRAVNGECLERVREEMSGFWPTLNNIIVAGERPPAG